MLHEFLTEHHDELIKRCRAKAALRYEPKLDAESIDHGVPLFLQQLEGILRAEQTTKDRSETAATARTPSSTEIGRAAALHGTELQRLGFTVDQVVHGYGDVCQVVTGLAVDSQAPISPDEFRTLNRCLDNAIADAVTAYGVGHEVSAKAQMTTLSGRLDAFGDEQRRLVDIAVHAYDAMKTGNIGLSGATGALLVHTLDELRSLPGRILPEIRRAAAPPPAAVADPTSSLARAVLQFEQEHRGDRERDGVRDVAEIGQRERADFHAYTANCPNCLASFRPCPW